jgi:putative ABC transport system permease protein
MPADADERRLVCVLGEEAARLLGADGHTGAAVRIEDRLYVVVGILRERRTREAAAAAVASRDYNRSVLLPLGSEPEGPVDRRVEEGAALDEIIVRVREGRSIEATAAAVRSVLARLHGGVEDFQVVVPRELLRQAQRSQGIFNWVLGCIAGISLLVGGIGIMNTMLASVAERTREVGLRRAVGASRGQVALQFLAEAVVLTAAGGSLGAAAGIAAAAAITALAGWATALTWWALGLALTMAVGVGLLAGLYPALRASRLDPIAALRRE